MDTNERGTCGVGRPDVVVPEGSRRKTAKNRQHFDLRAVGAVRSEVDRLLALGASVVHQSKELVVLIDPEGNEFCLEP